MENWELGIGELGLEIRIGDWRFGYGTGIEGVAVVDGYDFHSS